MQYRTNEVPDEFYIDLYIQRTKSIFQVVLSSMMVSQAITHDEDIGQIIKI
jgi:hypothetical protein